MHILETSNNNHKHDQIVSCLLTCAWTRWGSICCWNIGNTVVMISFWEIEHPIRFLSLWTLEIKCECSPPICCLPKKLDQLALKTTKKAAIRAIMREFKPYNSYPQIKWFSDFRMQSIYPFKNYLTTRNRAKGQWVKK